MVVVVSGVVLTAGATCFVALAAATAWSPYLDRQMTARVTAEGCPPEVAMGGLTHNRGTSVGPIVTRLSQFRWRVAIPKRDSTSFYVVNTPRELTDSQMIELAGSRVGSTDFMAPRWAAMPRVEIVDCLWTAHEIGQQNRTAISSRFVDWWMGRSFVWVVRWPVAMLTPPELTIVPAIIASPILLAAALTALTAVQINRDRRAGLAIFGAFGRVLAASPDEVPGSCCPDYARGNSACAARSTVGGPSNG